MRENEMADSGEVAGFTQPLIQSFNLPREIEGIGKLFANLSKRTTMPSLIYRQGGAYRKLLNLDSLDLSGKGASQIFAVDVSRHNLNVTTRESLNGWPLRLFEVSATWRIADPIKAAELGPIPTKALEMDIVRAVFATIVSLNIGDTWPLRRINKLFDEHLHGSGREEIKERLDFLREVIDVESARVRVLPLDAVSNSDLTIAPGEMDANTDLPAIAIRRDETADQRRTKAAGEEVEGLLENFKFPPPLIQNFSNTKSLNEDAQISWYMREKGRSFNNYIAVRSEFEILSHKESGEAEVSVYTSAKNGERLKEALVEALNAFGISAIEEEPPILGSWFQRLRIKLSRAANGEAMANKKRAIGAAVELYSAGKVAADISKSRSEAVKNLLDAVQNEPEAVVRIDNIVIVKTAGRVVVNTIDEAQALELNRRFDILNNPALVFEFLSQMRGDASVIARSIDQDMKSHLDGGTERYSID
ncbi:hypothetical protein [Kutzneria sp. NPDC052558]|uniref:hypothetical protein n=1 Tax=Kutzneria sp. NPDC052558 TaxID=3364121 RepID=UPI0037CB0EE4